MGQFNQFEMNVQNKFFVKTLYVKGYKVMINYNKEDNNGDIIIFLKDHSVKICVYKFFVFASQFLLKFLLHTSPS